MHHNKKQTIKIEESYDVDTLTNILYGIIVRLKWQRYALDRINKKEQDLNNKRNGAARTSILPASMGFVALMAVIIPSIVGARTNSFSATIVSLLFIIGVPVALFVLFDKLELKRRNTLRDERSTITHEVSQLITPDIAQLLHLDLPINSTQITHDELVRVYNNARAMVAIIHTLTTDYKAKTIFSISPFDTQRLLKNASQYTTSILYQDEKDTMCVFALNTYQTHYYEFNESTKAFDYITDTIQFIKNDDDLSE